MKSRLIWVSICLIVYCSVRSSAFSQSTPSQAKHAAKIESLAKEYNSFDGKDWKKRRDFCIRMIDEGVINDATRISDIRRIFGPDVNYGEATEKLPAGGYVAFERPLKRNPNGPSVQTRLGWHFAFESSANGYLSNYWLTDFNK